MLPRCDAAERAQFAAYTRAQREAALEMGVALLDFTTHPLFNAIAPLLRRVPIANLLT